MVAAFVNFNKTLDTTSFVKPDVQNVFVVSNPDGSVFTAPSSSLSTYNQGQTSSINSAATTNATVAKNKAGYITSIYASNANAAVRYLKIYNKATAPTVGTDTPVLVYAIPAAGSINFDLEGQRFSNGISYAVTTGVADSDTGAVAANEVKVSINYR